MEGKIIILSMIREKKSKYQINDLEIDPVSFEIWYFDEVAKSKIYIRRNSMKPETGRTRNKCTVYTLTTKKKNMCVRSFSLLLFTF